MLSPQFPSSLDRVSGTRSSRPISDGCSTATVYALILTVGVALHQLLDPSQFGQIPAYAGITIAITLFGWGLGGLIGGILADYIGRKRTMILAILAYSLLTGLSAIAWSWTSFAILRFLVGVAIGSEWPTGASITAELWPAGARGRGAGLMHCGLGVGFFIASTVWVCISGLRPDAALHVSDRRSARPVHAVDAQRHAKSAIWGRVTERQAAARKRSGDTFAATDHALTRFTLVRTFR